MPPVSTADLEPLLHSPRLPDIVKLLDSHLRREREKRQDFYQEMTGEVKEEFIDGEVVLHSPARLRHLAVTDNARDLLRMFARKHGLGPVFTEKCLCCFTRNDYEPDIVFFTKEKAAAFTPETMKFPVPDLIVEVLSESTAARDRGVKFEDYAGHGVGEYWIIDPEREILEQYLLRDGGYELAVKSGTGEVGSEVLQGFRVPVRALFDADVNEQTLQEILR